MAVLGSNIVRKTASSERLRRSRTLVVLSFALITAASYAADATNRPVTSALIYVLGVMAIGALRGRRQGLLAALAASFIYSALIKNPALEFEHISADYFVPLIAFNITALLSGTLAGRLKDRAEFAESSRNQRDLLLKFSSELQRAVRLEDVASALQSVVSAQVIRDSILPYVASRQTEARKDSLHHVLELAEAGGAPAAADSQFDADDLDLPAFIDLLSMAVERCDLLDQQAEGQAIQRSEDLKTTILSSLSHDLRTPIAAIAASAASLRRFGDTFSPDVRAEMLQTIEDQCARLDRFTAKLLSFGRLQGGVVARQLEPADVVELLGNAVGSARLTGPSHLVRKEFPQRPAIVMADPAMLEQVFFNILENAVIYTPAGSEILIRVEIGDGVATVTITDTGRGVSAENIDHIFEPFFRSERSKHTNGQGLGLFIAKGFVETFEGKIVAKSPHDAGQGLQISITLPLAKLEMVENADA